MDESTWICERCGEEYDLEMGEGRVLLAEEMLSPEDDRLSSLEPYGAVCYDCADVLYGLVEKCDRNCLDCEVPKTWGLSVRDCLQFQLKFDLLDLPLPQGKVNFMGCLYDAKEVLEVFNPFWRQHKVR